MTPEAGCGATLLDYELRQSEDRAVTRQQLCLLCPMFPPAGWLRVWPMAADGQLYQRIYLYWERHGHSLAPAQGNHPDPD